MRAFWAVVVAVLVVAFAAEARYRGASSSGAAPRTTLARLLGDGAPHPTGSPALAAMRGRVAAELRAGGLAVDERATLACGRYGTCARVHQVVGRIAGRASTGTVLLLAHADAVAASGGASDDGAGVAAVVEVGRALARTAPRNDVLLAVVEGEELGLLGAEAFVAADPRATDVRVVVNLEARGARGPAQLFQTSHSAGALVALATRDLPRPVGSSLFPAVYERMPNDTDLTVFLEHGYAGLNFAFSDGVEAYHTPHDDLAHQAPASLAHLTECAGGAVRALAGADLRALAPASTVWFDVLGAFVVAWPEAWSLPLAALGLAGVAWSAARALRSGHLAPRAIALGIWAWLVTMLACAAAGALAFMLRPSVPWTARPWPGLALLWGTPLLVSLLFARALGDRLRAHAAALATALVHGVFAVLLARLLPAASYLLIVPVLASAVAFPWLVRRPTLAVALPALAGLVASALVLRALYPGLGWTVAPALPLVAALYVLPFAPLWVQLSRRAQGRAAGALSLVALVLATLAARAPTFSGEVTRRVNVVHIEEQGASQAVFAVDPTWGGAPWGPPPREMIAALGPAARERVPTPWHAAAAWVAPSPVVGLHAPRIDVLERTAARTRFSMRSRRGAATLVLLAPPGSGLVRLEVEGASPAPRLSSFGLATGWRALRLDGADDVVLVATMEGGAGELIALDATAGLPPGAAAVASARPADALPTQDGDRTLVFARFRP